MLTLHDLKCGNVLVYNTEDGWMPTVVDWMDLQQFDYSAEQFNQKYRPLPITDEVLRLSGFEVFIYGWYALSGLTWNVYDKTIRYKGTDLKTTEHFHELQNLFYSLRGEMLTLPDEFRDKTFEI